MAGGRSSLVPPHRNPGKTGDVATGVTVVKEALSEPARRIALNAGQDGSVIVA